MLPCYLAAMHCFKRVIRLQTSLIAGAGSPIHCQSAHGRTEVVGGFNCWAIVEGPGRRGSYSNDRSSQLKPFTSRKLFRVSYLIVDFILIMLDLNLL